MNKKPVKRVLGRGLASLIPIEPDDEPMAPEARPEAAYQEVIEVDAGSIRPNPFQPRRDFNEDEIKELAASIEKQGLLQPVLVRQKENDGFEIISGERRFRALKLLGREKIPCIIKKQLSDREMMEMALVENIQREDLNEIDKAEAYNKLIIEFDYTHEQLSERLGKNRTTITNTLRLRTLPEEIQQMVRTNALTSGHARALLSLSDEAQQLKMARSIIQDQLSVRAVETRVQSDVGNKKPRKSRADAGKVVDPIIADAISKLQYRLGTAVGLKTDAGMRGRLEIEFYSESDLTRIFDILLPRSE